MKKKESKKIKGEGRRKQRRKEGWKARKEEGKKGRRNYCSLL